MSLQLEGLFDRHEKIWTLTRGTKNAHCTILMEDFPKSSHNYNGWHIVAHQLWILHTFHFLINLTSFMSTVCRNRSNINCNSTPMKFYLSQPYFKILTRDFFGGASGNFSSPQKRFSPWGRPWWLTEFLVTTEILLGIVQTSVTSIHKGQFSSNKLCSVYNIHAYTIQCILSHFGIQLQGVPHISQ